MDADLWNGLLGVSFDLFQRDRDGLMANRIVAVPGTFGASMPKENLESDRTRGFELELRHHNRIGEVGYSVTGNMAITRSMWRYKERTPSGNSYDNWRNNLTDRYMETVDVTLLGTRLLILLFLQEMLLCQVIIFTKTGMVMVL